MPINIPNSLPANSQLRRENIFVMNESAPPIRISGR